MWTQWESNGRRICETRCGYSLFFLSVLLYYHETMCNLGGKGGGVLGPRPCIEEARTKMSTAWE